MSELTRLTADIAAQTPDRCKGCAFAELQAALLARKVIDNTVELVDAKATLHTRVKELCDTGLVQPGTAQHYGSAPYCGILKSTIN